MSDISRQYDHALTVIGDLTPYVALVQQLDQLSREGRVNDMRRVLVIAVASALEEQETRILGNVLFAANNSACSLAQLDSLERQSANPDFEAVPLDRLYAIVGELRQQGDKDHE
jgi:hypothetical protein